MKALFLDFDGVLHPSTHIVGKDMPRLALSGSKAITDTGMFCWAHLLEQALRQDDDCEEIGIVVHSSWRNVAWATPELIRQLLGPLAHRLMGFAQPDMPREKAINLFIERAQIADYLILDDAISEFDDNRPELVVTNPLLGVSDEAVLERVRCWARRTSPKEHSAPTP